MRCSSTGTAQPSWKREMLAALQFVNVYWKREFRDDAPQPLDYIAGTRRSINVERLRSPRVCHHEKHSWQPCYMICVHMRQANSSELTKSPTQRFPGHLCPLPAVHKRQRRSAPHQSAREPAPRHRHHATCP